MSGVQDLGSPTASTMEPFVRAYNATTDYNAVNEICMQTAHPAITTILPLVPWLYAIPYTAHSPSTCFVLDNGTGTAIGYILAIPSVYTFAASWPSYFQDPSYAAAIAAAGSNRAAELMIAQIDNAAHLLRDDKPGFSDQFPARLHINILPEGQRRRGYGRMLMEALLRELRGKGVKGVHLGMAKDNEGAGRFYQAMGFKESPFDDAEDPEAEGRWFVMELGTGE